MKNLNIHPLAVVAVATLLTITLSLSQNWGTRQFITLDGHAINTSHGRSGETEVGDTVILKNYVGHRITVSHIVKAGEEIPSFQNYTARIRRNLVDTATNPVPVKYYVAVCIK